MMFYKKPANKKQIQCLYDIARFFKIRLKIIYDYKNYGINLCCFEKDEITLYISKKMPMNELYSNFFHEFAHLYNKYNRLFPYQHVYHPIYFTKKEWANFFRTMKRSELFTEKMGKKLMNLFFPNIRYISYYSKNNPDTDFQMKEHKKEIIEFYKLKQKGIYA